jgi:transcriptional regulator with XRE-family HTH domain
VTAPRALTPNHKRVRELRIEKALSQRELARIAGIRPGTVNRVEQGLPTRLATIAAIALALGVQPLDIARVDG